MTIKLFALEAMTYTPFEEEKGAAILKENDIVTTQDPRDADLFISRKWRTNTLLNLIFRHGARKPLLIWTHEPRFCVLTTDRFAGPFGVPKVHVMNVFNKNVYLCNYTIYGYNIRGELPPITPSDLNDKPSRKAVALARYSQKPREQRLVIDGIDVDLVARRQRIILAGHRRGVLDVYGKGWPSGIALVESRIGNWHESKAEILKQYRFNICTENTDFDYYVTEKIWDAINARCMPIYRGGRDKIYQDFERGSFVDTKDFKTPEQLFDSIESMSDAEYCDRLNSCIATYNAIWKRHDYDAQYRRMVQTIVHQVEEIIHSSPHDGKSRQLP